MRQAAAAKQAALLEAKARPIPIPVPTLYLSLPYPFTCAAGDQGAPAHPAKPCPRAQRGRLAVQEALLLSALRAPRG